MIQPFFVFCTKEEFSELFLFCLQKNQQKGNAMKTTLNRLTEDQHLTEDQQLMVIKLLPDAKLIASKFFDKKDETLCGYSFEDLYSECYLKMIECAPLFDESRGTQFITFAHTSMQNKMIDLMRRKKYLYKELEDSTDLTDGEYTSITVKEPKGGRRGRGPLGKNTFPAHVDKPFDRINIKKLKTYCNEIDSHLQGLPASAFDMIYPKIMNTNIKSREVAQFLCIDEKEYNNGMNRIRQWLRKTHKDIAMIEDCCEG